MKFGDLLEEKRRDGPEDFAPYYVRCAPCSPPWARSPAAVPATRGVPPAARRRTRVSAQAAALCARILARRVAAPSSVAGVRAKDEG